MCVFRTEAALVTAFARGGKSWDLGDQPFDQMWLLAKCGYWHNHSAKAMPKTTFDQKPRLVTKNILSKRK